MQTLMGSGVHFGDLQFCLLTIAIRTMILVKARNNLNLVRIVKHGYENIKTQLVIGRNASAEYFAVVGR